MLSCDFSTHALYELCIIEGKFVMRLELWCVGLLCYCILKCGANGTKPNVRLIKIPVQCFGYMVFGNNMSFLIRAWKISNKCSILCTFVCISPAKAFNETCTWSPNQWCVGATANVSSLHTQVLIVAEALSLYTINWCLINIHSIRMLMALFSSFQMWRLLYFWILFLNIGFSLFRMILVIFYRKNAFDVWLNAFLLQNHQLFHMFCHISDIIMETMSLATRPCLRISNF